MQCALRAVDIFGIWQIEAVSSFDDYLGWVKRLSVASSRVRRNLLSPCYADGAWSMSGVVQVSEVKKDGIDSKKKGDPHG